MATSFSGGKSRIIRRTTDYGQATGKLNKQTKNEKDEQHGLHKKSGFLNIINISFT
jgi:hypothetical protein